MRRVKREVLTKVLGWCHDDSHKWESTPGVEPDGYPS